MLSGDSPGSRCNRVCTGHTDTQDPLSGSACARAWRALGPHCWHQGYLGSVLGHICVERNQRQTLPSSNQREPAEFSASTGAMGTDCQEQAALGSTSCTVLLG